jgi:hypothetical protein
MNASAAELIASAVRSKSYMDFLKVPFYRLTDLTIFHVRLSEASHYSALISAHIGHVVYLWKPEH